MNGYGYGAQAYTDFMNTQPAVVKGRWNADTEYNKRYLWYQIYSVYKFTLPRSWDLSWFRFWLFHTGSICVIYTKEYGWIAYPYGISKLGLQYQPKEVIVTSEFLKKDKIGRVGVNCEIVKLLDDYFSLDDLVTRYATTLAQIDKSINVNLMNTNVAFVFGAENKKQGDTIKEAYAQATEGKPLVVVNKEILSTNGLQPFFPDVGGNFVVQQLLDAKRTVVNEFLTKIGIRNANYGKRERLNSMEVSENNDETKSIASVILDNIKDGFTRLDAIGCKGLDVQFAFDYNDGGESNATINHMGDDDTRANAV